MQCFGMVHALRSADIKLKCPGSLCAYQSRSWIVHSPVVSKTGSTQSWQQIEQCIDVPTDFKRHHNLFFWHQEFNTAADKKRSSDHTTQKVGKVFCHTVKIFCANKLWSWQDINQLNIDRSNPKINPEMINMPVVGEVRMNSYISFNFKQDGFPEDESNGTAKDSMLLKQINPMVEIRLSNDKVNLD